MQSAKWRPFCLGLNVLLGKYSVHVHHVSLATPLVATPLGASLPLESYPGRTDEKNCSLMNWWILHSRYLTAGWQTATSVWWHALLYPTPKKLRRGVLILPCPSVRLYTKSCPLCISHNTSQIHFKFAHLINQVQKVCHVLSFSLQWRHNVTIASQITSLTIVYSTVYSDADQRKHQSSASLAFVRGIHRWPVNSPQKWPVTRKMFPFDDVIMLPNSFYLMTEHIMSWPPLDVKICKVYYQCTSIFFHFGNSPYGEDVLCITLVIASH